MPLLKGSVRKVSSWRTKMVVLHSSAPCAHLALLLILTMLQCVWVVPGTAIHADSPFNRLKAALNYDRHVVDKRDNAPVALTRRGLSSLVQDPAELIFFIQKEFMLKDGSRISFKAAVPLAFGVCTLFRTCAVALAVPRCTPRPTGDQCCRAFLAFPHCVWVSARISRYGGAACKPLAFSMLTGAHERRCAMVRRARWPRGYVHRRHPPILRLEPLQVRPRWPATVPRWCNGRGHCPERSPL